MLRRFAWKENGHVCMSTSELHNENATKMNTARDNVYTNIRNKYTILNKSNTIQVNQQQQSWREKGIHKYANAQTTSCHDTRIVPDKARTSTLRTLRQSVTI